MSRRAARHRRYARRHGWGRHEPVPLLLVPDDDRTLGEVIAACARLIYRYRSELAPLAAAVLMVGLGAWLHAYHPDWWPLPLVLAVAAVAGLVLAPGRWATWWAVLGRRAERIYAGAVAILVGGWVGAATAAGPGSPPLPLLAAVGTLVLALPWWAHHRRRARVRVERTIQAWPQIADAVGLAGSRVLSAMVDRWGWTARLALRRGQAAKTAVDAIPALESGLAARPGAVRVEPDPARADRVILRVIETDPHAQPIPRPRAASDDSINRPIEIGLWEDGTPVRVLLLRRHALIGGVIGSGKSGVLNVLLAALTGCPDVLLWGIDLKQGMELAPWRACLPQLATTPADAVAVLRAAATEVDRRAATLAAHGRRVWEPTPQAPALIVVIDEYAELSDQARELADSVARRGRAVAVTLLAATQRPTQRAMGASAVRSQMDVRICLRVRERRDTDLILGQGMLAAGWHPHTLDAPGKFLLSAPEHTTPRRGRAYHLDDNEVSTTATRNAHRQPSPHDSPPADDSADQAGAAEPGEPGEPATPETNTGRPEDEPVNPEVVLWRELRNAPEHGTTVADLMKATRMGRTWVYDRLHEHAEAGRVVQTYRGRWRAAAGHEE